MPRCLLVKDALLSLWQLFVLVGVGGFFVAYLWQSFHPSDDEPKYRWEMPSSYRPKYPPPPEPDGEEK
jgi:hypothetical protein